MTASAQAVELVERAAEAAVNKGGHDLIALDVSEPLAFADVFLLITGRTERNVLAIAEGIEEKLAEHGIKRLRTEGRQEGRWVLIDFGDLVVHIFHDDERSFYSLERLWKDCPVLALPDFDE